MRMRLEVDRVITRSDGERRRLARIVLQRSIGFDLLAFRAVDTHLHLDLAEPRDRSVELCRRISISWYSVDPGGPRLITLDPKPIRDQWHLQNTFRYILDQAPRHGYEVDLFHEASVLVDLLGLRVTGAQVLARVRELLPRIRRQELLDRLGPVDLRRPIASFVRLAEAAAAAVALPDLEGRDAERSAARRAAALAVRPHLDTREIADLLGVSRRRVEQLQIGADRPRVGDALVRAVELQLRLRSEVDAWLKGRAPELRAWPKDLSGSATRPGPTAGPCADSAKQIDRTRSSLRLVAPKRRR